MARKRKRTMSHRRTRRRYVTMVVLVLALIGGWSWFWHYAADKAQVALDGWRAREAKAGRIYSCGTQSVGGYPFRFEVECDQASALFRSNQPPVEIKASGMSIAAQVYQPNLLITEFHGPLTIADLGQAPNIIVNWKLAQSSVSGTPASPERVSLVFDKPMVERVSGGNRQTILRAQHIEIHGRIAEGSAASRPVIETVLRLRQASAADIAPVLGQPVDADITAVLRGLNNFAPKPWPARFREIQAAGGRIDITAARVQQGDTIAVGEGALSLNANGRLQGQLHLTVAGIEPFLAAMGAQQIMQNSQDMNKVAGALDRLLPGLGGMARQQATGSNLSLGINLLGQHTTLEGKPAVIVPLHFDDGSIFLGPLKIGDAPALF
jgi:hypothetical protein